MSRANSGFPPEASAIRRSSGRRESRREPAGDQLDESFSGERTERDAASPICAEGPFERQWIELLGRRPSGRQEPDGLLVEAPGDERERGGAGRVDPPGIVDGEEYRRSLGQPAQHAAHGQPHGLRVGLADTADVGSRQGMVEGVALHVRQHRAAVLDHGAEEIAEGEEGQLGLDFDACAAQHGVTACGGRLTAARNTVDLPTPASPVTTRAWLDPPTSARNSSIASRSIGPADNLPAHGESP